MPRTIPPRSARTRSISAGCKNWIRIERYWDGEYPDLKARFIPIMCQQCQHAPCEPVCPVFATYHSDEENLNIQVYNRCVGTRYCANNCLYVARFFNWFEPYFPEPLNEQLNPDVTVRSRGVMEKCTFCIQRIKRAEDTGAGGTATSCTTARFSPHACSPARPRRWSSATCMTRTAGWRSSSAASVPSGSSKIQRHEPAVIYLKGGESHAG